MSEENIDPIAQSLKILSKVIRDLLTNQLIGYLKHTRKIIANFRVCFLIRFITLANHVRDKCLSFPDPSCEIGTILLPFSFHIWIITFHYARPCTFLAEQKSLNAPKSPQTFPWQLSPWKMYEKYPKNEQKRGTVFNDDCAGEHLPYKIVKVKAEVKM